MLGQRTAQSSRCVALGNRKAVLSEIRRKEFVPVRIGSYRDVVAGCDETFTYKQVEFAHIKFLCTFVVGEDGGIALLLRTSHESAWYARVTRAHR